MQVSAHSGRYDAAPGPAILAQGCERQRPCPALQGDAPRSGGQVPAQLEGSCQFSVQTRRTQLPSRRGGERASPRGSLQLSGCDFPSRHQVASHRVTGHPS